MTEPSKTKIEPSATKETEPSAGKIEPPATKEIEPSAGKTEPSATKETEPLEGKTEPSATKEIEPSAGKIEPPATKEIEPSAGTKTLHRHRWPFWYHLKKQGDISWYVRLNIIILSFLFVLFLIKKVQSPVFQAGLNRLFTSPPSSTSGRVAKIKVPAKMEKKHSPQGTKKLRNKKTMRDEK